VLQEKIELRAFMTSAGQGSSMRNIVAISWLLLGELRLWGSFRSAGTELGEFAGSLPLAPAQRIVAGDRRKDRG
jgi:hypothetical protein